MTAAAASCPLGPAHAVIKMRTHQHTIHCSPAPAGETIQFLVTREAPAPAPAAAAAPVYSPAAQPRVTAARHGQMLQLPGRGGAGAGSPGGGADCDNILCTALDWPPAYTGRPPPRRPGFIGAVFSRAACNPRLGRAADCHILARVTCHVSRVTLSPSSARPHTDCFAWLLCGRLGLRTLDTARAQMSPAPSRTLM